MNAGTMTSVTLTCLDSKLWEGVSRQVRKQVAFGNKLSSAAWISVLSDLNGLSEIFVRFRMTF